MSLRPIIMLGLAVLFGGLAVVMARQWLSQNAVVEASVDTDARLTTVVVARVPLGFGSRLAAENLAEVRWPQDAVPPGTFTAIADLAGGDQERVVLRGIEANEPILASKISGEGGRATLSAVIAPDMRGVTIAVNDIYGVAGFVLPGDRVDIMLTRSPDRSNPITDVLLQNVKVLAIDQQASENKDTPKVARAVTLEVSQEQAQKLTLGANVGTLSLALRNQANAEADKPRTISLDDLRIGEANEVSKTEAAKKPEPTPIVRSRPGPPRPSVRIVRGMQSSTVTVKN